jgi:hypothetical protein
MNSFARGGFTICSPGRPGKGRALVRVVVLVCAALASSSQAYTVLTHEQIVDVCWEHEIEPLLLARFPAASAAQLRHAHAYAYGGCVIQDTGYYPFGNRLFSDLVHYVRSGDFVANLIRESADLDEYAFALGALAHYSSDNSGHPFINRAVALGFPKLRAKYGDSVNYAEDPKAHIRTEFGFDLVQIAKNRYTSERYRNFIGFEVSEPVLKRAFARTYGLELEDVMGHFNLAVGTFRRAVSQAIPKMTRVALILWRPELVRDHTNFSKRKFLYNLSRSEYEKEWGKDYRKPNLGERLLAVLVGSIPKIGPMKVLSFKAPTPQTEDLYMKSVNLTLDSYRNLLRQVRQANLVFPNLDCDTGHRVRAGEYVLSDETYEHLLRELTRKGLDRVSPDLRADVLAFYAQPPPSPSKAKARKAWSQAIAQVDVLKVLAQEEPRSSKQAFGTNGP